MDSLILMGRGKNLSPSLFHNGIIPCPKGAFRMNTYYYKKLLGLKFFGGDGGKAESRRSS
jgi:hypothetical protein